MSTINRPPVWLIVLVVVLWLLVALLLLGSQLDEARAASGAVGTYQIAVSTTGVVVLWDTRTGQAWKMVDRTTGQRPAEDVAWQKLGRSPG